MSVSLETANESWPCRALPAFCLRHEAQSTEATDSETVETTADEPQRHRPPAADNATSARPRFAVHLPLSAVRRLPSAVRLTGAAGKRASDFAPELHRRLLHYRSIGTWRSARHVKWKQSVRRGGDQQR